MEGASGRGAGAGVGRGDRLSRVAEVGLPAAELGLLSGQTVVGALLPVLLSPHVASTFAIGAVLALEGMMALVMPYAVGAASDSLPRVLVGRFGRRGFMMLLSAPVMVLSLVLLPFRDGFWTLTGTALVFFVALHAFQTPFRTLVIESVPERRWGRVQGAQGALHAGGVAFGLVGGGLLYALWVPLPFVVAAVLIAATLVVTLWLSPGSDRRRGSSVPSAGGGGVVRQELNFIRELLGRERVRWYLSGHVLWSAGSEGIRPFIFLFALTVIGIRMETAALVVGALLAGVAIGAVLIGWLGDRFGRVRVLQIGVVLAGVAMLPGVFVRSVPAAVAFLVPAGLGAASLMTLPYPIFAGLVQDLPVGRSTGVFNVFTGSARLGAPLLMGGAIDAGAVLFPEYDGYPVMWPVAGVVVLLGALAVRRAGGQAGLSPRRGHGREEEGGA